MGIGKVVRRFLKVESPGSEDRKYVLVFVSLLFLFIIICTIFKSLFLLKVNFANKGIFDGIPRLSRCTAQEGGVGLVEVLEQR